MDSVQAFNLRLAKNEVYTFKPFEVPPQGSTMPFDLCDLDLEVRLLPRSLVAARALAPIVRVDTNKLAQAFQEQALGSVVAMNQSFVLAMEEEAPDIKDTTSGSRPMVDVALRVTCANTLEEEEQAQILAGYHCYRGLLTPHTKLYFNAIRPSQNGSSHQSGGGELSGEWAPHTYADFQGASSASPQLVLEHPRHRPPPKNRRDTVDVHTQDSEGGELFTVKKALLRPCIALTTAIRNDSAESPSPICVDVDTLTFDRVLIFLEARACGQDPPLWSLHLLEDLQRAATVLGLRPLMAYCQNRLGQLSDNLKLWRFQEVVKANNQGRSILILDGMVLDVTDWLHQHPGGSTIIPAQALNVDCGRFFEIYHASRESFLYLHDFYLGEVHPADRSMVQQGRGEYPSDDFLHQLRQYTTWRLAVSGGHSGDHLHLGRSAR